MHDIFGLRSDEGEQVYIWRNEDTELYFDKGDIVRFRVESEEWHDQSLLAPPAKGDTTSEIERKVPYSIVVSTRASSVTGHRLLVLAFRMQANKCGRGKGFDAAPWSRKYTLVVIGNKDRELERHRTK